MERMAELAVSNKYKKGEVQRHFLFKVVEIFQYDRSHHYLKFQNWRGKYLVNGISELIYFGSFCK